MARERAIQNQQVSYKKEAQAQQEILSTEKSNRLNVQKVAAREKKELMASREAETNIDRREAVRKIKGMFVMCDSACACVYVSVSITRTNPPPTPLSPLPTPTQTADVMHKKMTASTSRQQAVRTLKVRQEFNPYAEERRNESLQLGKSYKETGRREY